MEEKNVKIFWKPVDGGELEELEYIGKVDGFDFEQLGEQIDVKYDPTPFTYSLSFDMVLDSKQFKKIRKMFYCRIPRKKKKQFKKAVARYYGYKIRDIKVSKYWGDYIAKQYDTRI